MKAKTKKVRGRRFASESQATEIRARLVAWKQSPEPHISLRELAAEIGTSHQLLSYYLEGLEDWQLKERRLECTRNVKSLRDQAADWDRPLPLEERRRMLAQADHEERRGIAISLAAGAYKLFRTRAKSSRLEPCEERFLAKLGTPEALEILKLSKDNRVAN